MSKYDLYRNTICKESDNDYIILFKDEESAKTVFNEFNEKDQRIAELEKELEDAILSADFYMKSSTGYTDEFNKLKHENFELEEELAELKAQQKLKELEGR